MTENKKYQSYYEDICIGVQKLRYTGGCYVVTVPKAIVEQQKLKKNSKFIVTLHVRTKKFHEELKDGEEWIKMPKRERIMCKRFLEQKKKDVEEIEKSLTGEIN